MSFLEVNPPEITFNFHQGQRLAMNSKKAVVLVLAGVRGGKTALGSPWLWREMVRKGAGDYLVAAPSLKLLDKAAVPELEHVLGRVLKLGTMTSHPFQFKVSREGEGRLWGDYQERPSRIVFGHADDPDTLAAMQAKAAWLDEAGQRDFKLSSFEEIRTRLSIDRGRCLLTTTVYNLDWLKRKVYDVWIASGKNHPEIDVIQFDSLMNPSFSREEWDRAQRDLPVWRFNMRHRGYFERPAGLILDCFDDRFVPHGHLMPRFAIPDHWPRYCGLDFGPINTAAIFFAAEMQDRVETGRLFAYREYYPRTQKSCKEHADALQKGEARLPMCVGGAPRTEEGWREAFRAAGLPVIEPMIREVEVGIARCYAALKRGELIFFSDLERTLQEIQGYSRELDDAGEPTDKIDDKSSFHICDSIRYIIGWLKPEEGAVWQPTFHPDAQSEMDKAPPGIWGR